MQDEQRFNLLFGPYHPPKTRRGTFLFCEMRGTVKVGDYSDGLIPWPVKWGTRNSLILCGDLVRAVQVESAQGVAHHWGVRPSTVTRYRKALQVERDTTGTRQLYRGNFQERLLPQANRLGAVFVRKPRIRVKIFRRLVNQPLHAKVRAVFRALIQHPNSRKLKRRPGAWAGASRGATGLPFEEAKEEEPRHVARGSSVNAFRKFNAKEPNNGRTSGSPIPKGLCLPAQGCEERATLGGGRQRFQPQRGCVSFSGSGQNPVGVVWSCRDVPG